MREHKYKIWDKTNKCWDESGDIYLDQDGVIYLIEERSMGHEFFMHKENVSDRYEIVFYTGLHDDTDEDQNELFESYIAEVEYEGQKHICLIKYESGGFLFASDSLPDSYLYLSELAEYDRTYGWVEGAKKLGNRFEHPHLLGGNQT